MNFENYYFIFLGTTLIFLLGFGLSEGIRSYQDQKEAELESALFNMSVTTADTVIFTILNQAQSCQPVTINYRNQTHQLILVSCLQRNGSS